MTVAAQAKRTFSRLTESERERYAAILPQHPEESDAQFAERLNKEYVTRPIDECPPVGHVYEGKIPGAVSASIAGVFQCENGEYVPAWRLTPQPE